MQEKPSPPLVSSSIQEKSAQPIKHNHVVSDTSAPHQARSKKLAWIIAILAGCQLYRSFGNLVTEPWSLSGKDKVEDGYAAGLADKGWKLGLEDVDPAWLEAIDHGPQDPMERHRSGHHGHHLHHGHHGHHGSGKHRDGSHTIGPKEAEVLFLKVPNNDSVAAASKRYTAYPHLAGTGEDLFSALTLKAEYEKFLGIPYSAPYDKIFPAGTPENQEAIRGLKDKDEPEVWIDTYYPLMNKPVSRSVDILLPGGNGAVEWSAKLREDLVEGDPDSKFRDEVPTFHGLSVSGNVTGRILFAGYGSKQDFEALEANGYDLRKEPTIVLVKYGKVFRGLKVKAAQEAGAIGCLIYSDPGDDGEKTIKNGYKAYPEGPARQPSSVQRGSVQFLSSYPGDPSTPGYPAYKNATRVPGGNFPEIPSLPISYEDALPLLRSLQGRGRLAKEIGDDWEGGLTEETEYWTGPSEKEIRFVNEVDTKETPIWSVFAYIPGHIKDEVVVIGNHRDAWVLGGADPSSGTATVHEIMRGLSELRQRGWKPMRSILIASWDAEEYGLISSTEFCEDFGEWLQSNVVAYLNIDVSVSGNNFHGSASPSLANLLRDAAMAIEHPNDSSRTLWDMQDGGDWMTYNTEVRGLSLEDTSASSVNSIGIKALGSGSDYTAFLQRFGIASTDMGYGGGPNDAPYHYHSIYDSHTWQMRYGDPGFHKHAAAAKMLGLMTLRIADAIVLPINLTQYAQDLSLYLAKVETISESQNYSIDFSKLRHAIGVAQDAALGLHRHSQEVLDRLSKLSPRAGNPRTSLGSRTKAIVKLLKEVRCINKKLAGFESGFLSSEGIKEREWYKHKGTAPGKWLGYGATTFPGLTEAMTIDKDPAAAQQEANELTDLIEKMASRLMA